MKKRRRIVYYDTPSTDKFSEQKLLEITFLFYKNYFFCYRVNKL